MRIIVDMQGAQSASRFRGIGNYTRSLVTALADHTDHHEILLCLNGMLPEGGAAIRRQFGPLYGQDHIIEWMAAPNIAGCHVGNNTRRRASEIVRERFLQSLSGDCLLVSSHFEGFVDDAATSLGHTQSTLPCSMIAYDLIPAVHRSTYLKDPVYRLFYEEKLAQFAQADQFLCISDSTRDEVKSILDIPDDKLRAVYAGVGSAFETADRAAALRGPGANLKKYILYPGGLDERKNLRRLIFSFARLSGAKEKNLRLVIVGQVEPADKEKIFSWAAEADLSSDRILITGYVSEETLVSLYTCASLVVFPSMHEGFGLPLLEAMKCQTPVLGADAPGIREVAVRSGGLFDPNDTSALTSMMQRAVSDDDFRAELVEAGLQTLKDYSWTRSAQLTIDALADIRKPYAIPVSENKRQRLAFVSPLPPEKTGIADYSAELLPALAEHYDMVCVIDQPDLSQAIQDSQLKTITSEAFSKEAQDYDRILYHFGNSPYHTHMLGLLQRYPGVVVLHDQFFGSFLRYAENYLGWDHAFWRALYQSHGWPALIERSLLSDETAINTWPASREIISRALGIISHSDAARCVAQQTYNECYGTRWSTVRFPRATPIAHDPSTRGAKGKRFRVSTFGFIDSPKCPLELIEAWSLTPMSARSDCELVFVGENEGGEFGRSVIARIAELGLENSVRVTGFATAADYQQALRDTDLAVQLRKVTRGETSAAVFDCLAAGLPLVVNEMGAMRELPRTVARHIPEIVTSELLAEAMTELWENRDMRLKLGHAAAEHVARFHAPESVAKDMYQAIEGFYAGGGRMVALTLKDLRVPSRSLAIQSPDDLKILARATALNHWKLSRVRTLFVDVSAIVATEKLTGVERASRSILDQLLRSPPPGFRVEPVFATVQNGYRTASSYVCKMFGIPHDAIGEVLVEPGPGDVLFVLDWQPEISRAHRAVRAKWRSGGVRIIFFVFDLLPIINPQWFPDFVHDAHSEWMNCIASSDGAICISKTVALDLQTELSRPRYRIDERFSIGWAHLGSDISEDVALSDIAAETDKEPFVLMVGTVEPRKGYRQIIDAFEHAWAKGETMRLVVVGGAGWMVDDLIARLSRADETNPLFTWHMHASDALLVSLYKNCRGLIMASEGEGFGLPMIEAARYRKPLLVRDISVFREICGEYASYFNNDAPVPLARTLKSWFEDIARPERTQAEDILVHTWFECSKTIVSLLEDPCHGQWLGTTVMKRTGETQTQAETEPVG